MKVTTLVSDRRYFGVDALLLREGSMRALARVVGLPLDRARVSAHHLQQDFGVDTVAGEALVARFVEGGLLRPDPDTATGFALTPRFVEVAAARVVDPLPRAKAKRLVARAMELVRRINADWSRNPLAIDTLATCGDYLTREPNLAELRLGIVLCKRAPHRLSRWRSLRSESEGASDIRSALQAMSSFVRVTLADEAKDLPRPFSIVWRDEPGA